MQMLLAIVVTGCCVYSKPTNSSHYGFATQWECIGFHVEQRRAWWGNIKLVLLIKSAGKVAHGAHFIRLCCLWQQIIKQQSAVAFCGLRLWAKWLIVRLKSHFLNSQSRPSIIVCPAGKASAALWAEWFSLFVTWSPTNILPLPPVV